MEVDDEDLWGVEEGVPHEQGAEADVVNHPLIIHPLPILCYPYQWDLPANVQDGHMDRAYEPLVIDITCTLQNYRYQGGQYGAVESNPGKIVAVCYPNAYTLARHRFNLKCNMDAGTPWLEAHPTASTMYYTNAQEVGLPAQYPHHAIPMNARGGRNRVAYSKVRVFFEGIPSNQEVDGAQEIVDRPLTSDNVHIRPNDNMFTCRRMYTSLVRKYLYNNNEGTQQVGSETALFFPEGVLARRDAMRVRFQFMFIKGMHWAPLQGPHPQNIHLNPLLFRAPNALQQVLQEVQEAHNDFQYEPLQGNAHGAAVPAARPVRRYRQYAREGPSAGTRGAVKAQKALLLRRSARLARPTVGGGVGRTVGGANDGTLYAKLKERIYIKRSLDDFFTHSKAAICTPLTEAEICFPMSFMRCQLRSWVHQKEGDVILSDFGRVEEDFTMEILMDEDCKPPFEISTSFYDHRKRVINVFDCSKKVMRRVGSRGKCLYLDESKDLSDEEMTMWIWCAFQVHYFVEGVMDVKIDYTNFDACLKMYSFVFQVNISVFVMEMKGDRVSIEHLEHDEKPEKESFIGLIIQNAHVHAISSMRAYQRSQVNPISTSLHTYCDFCNTMSYSRTSNYAHQNKCQLDPTWKVCASLEDLHTEEAAKSEIRDKFTHLKPDVRNQLMCQTCYVAEKDCPCETKNSRMTCFVLCKVCNNPAPLNYYNNHKCYMKARTPKEKLPNDKIFVYDIESMQTFNESLGQYVHECILVCLRAVYDDRKWKFNTIPDFVRFLITTEEMKGAIILAHNGGGYDHQFVVRYLEDSSIMHTTTPRPSTLHKYLMVEITMQGGDTSIKFLDFLMMMTDSLRNIGTAFKLEACKGDFPHRFSRPEHLDYAGKMPSMEDEHDWYGFKEVKNQEELDNCRAYWTAQSLKYCYCHEGECNCNKPPWVFKEQLEAYCWLDVDVLAGACKAYRDQAIAFDGASEYAWSTRGIEPFQYMTQSQIALAIFMQGNEQNNIAITHEKIRPSFHSKQVFWLEDVQEKSQGVYEIQHAGNSFKEFFDVDTKTYVDGYCNKTKTVFEYLDCYTDGCPTCYQHEIAAKEMHAERGVRWDKVSDQTRNRLNTLRANNNYNHVIHRWSHEEENWPLQTQKPTLGNLMKLRDFFYGGRTEVFAAYADISKYPSKEMLHHDVCSLYPYVCSWKDLPIGIPTIHFNKTIDKARLHPYHPNRFFGFARIRVRPNTKDLIAILPQRTKDPVSGDEKLVYDLYEKEGCWHTELIYLAMEHQYEIVEVFEVWDWPPSQRSSTLMRGYMEFFLRMKQEAEGWGKLGKEVVGKKEEALITQEEKQAIAEHIFNNNGGFARPRIDKVEKNPVLRQLAKIFLNCLWGKLCQKSASEYERFIYGYKQYLEVSSNCLINQTSLKFRHVNGCVFKVRYQLNDHLQEKNRFLNIPIAASVTAHAQVILMRQMFTIGPERILYCDTDSIMFIRDKNAPILNRSGLGNWEDEHPGASITRFWALAPKCYMMEIVEQEESEYYFKCKGVRSTEENRKKTSFDKIHALVEQEYLGTEGLVIEADTMTIHPNSTNSAVPYGILCTNYGSKKIQVVFSKRELQVNRQSTITKLDDAGIVRLLPFGYNGTACNNNL